MTLKYDTDGMASPDDFSEVPQAVLEATTVKPVTYEPVTYDDGMGAEGWEAEQNAAAMAHPSGQHGW